MSAAYNQNFERYQKQFSEIIKNPHPSLQGFALTGFDQLKERAPELQPFDLPVVLLAISCELFRLNDNKLLPVEITDKNGENPWYRVLFLTRHVNETAGKLLEFQKNTRLGQTVKPVSWTPTFQVATFPEDGTFPLYSPSPDIFRNGMMQREENKVLPNPLEAFLLLTLAQQLEKMQRSA